MALGFSGHRDGRDRIPEPVDADVRILSWREEPTPEGKPSRFDEYIVEAQVPPVIPDPIRVRGIGSTTLYVLLESNQYGHDGITAFVLLGLD